MYGRENNIEVVIENSKPFLSRMIIFYVGLLILSHN